MDERFEDEIKRMKFRVTIFGSSRTKKGDPSYKQVKNLSYLLAQRGIDIVTGGGPGIMEAASVGHQEGRKKSGKNTHAIGLGIKLPHEQGFNSGVNVKKEFKKFSSRLDNFMLLSNVVVVAPGGIGTLLEFFYTWQLMQVNHTCHIPIILLGDMWGGLLKWLNEEPLRKKMFDERDIENVFHVRKSSEAMKLISYAFTA